MSLDKYKGFIGGEVLPAENVNSINPDDIIPQTAGGLTGGTDVVLANFQSLGSGANNGKIKINIDGTVYDNVGINLSGVASLSAVATLLQTAIRAVTSKLETVVYSTNKFIITSGYAGRTSQVLKLMTPTTGTDISGNNATKYLDLGAGATETFGTGEEYNLARLDANGVIPFSLLNGVNGSGLINLNLKEIRLTASDNLKLSADSERTVTDAITKVKEIKIYRAGVIRTKFDAKSTAVGGSLSYIYFNGVQRGTTRNTTGTTYVTYSEDLTITEADLLVTGYVLVQLYAFGAASAGNDAVVKNFRLYFDNTEVNDEIITD